MPTGIVYTYNAAGKVTAITSWSDSGVRQWANLYDPANNRLYEQDGFDASGNLTQKTLLAADGSKTLTAYTAAQVAIYMNVYNASGTLIEQDGYDSGGVLATKTIIAADGSKTLTAYTSGGVRQYANVYNAAGALTEQDGYDANDKLATRIVIAADGSRTLTSLTAAGLKVFSNIYNAAGTLTEQDGYDANGNLTQRIQIAADGTKTLTSISAGNIKLFSNVYNPSGVLIEQDGYDANGNLTTQIIIALDGSKTLTSLTAAGIKVFANIYNAAGTLIEQDGYDANGNLTQRIQIAADGTKTLTSISAGNVKLFSNVYNPSGVLIEQDGFDNAGNLTTRIIIAADGSKTLTVYNASGVHQYANVYDASGALVEQDGYAADGSSTRILLVNGVKTSLTGYNSSGALTFQNSYDASGALIKQIGYTGNVLTYSMAVAGDGTVTTSNWNAAGTLLNQSVTSAQNKPILQIYGNADGSYQKITYVNGVTSEVQGYDTAGHRILDNIYTAGVMTEQHFYTSAGVQTYSWIKAADGSIVQKDWDNAGNATEIDQISAAGVTLTATFYAADHSYTVLTRDAQNRVTDNNGFTAGGVPVYANHYDTTGLLVDQKGYYANGTLNTDTTKAADGSGTRTIYDTTGLLAEFDVLDTNGKVTTATTHKADGSYQVAQVNAAGTTVQLDAYASGGAHLYTVSFDASGHQIGQQGYYDDGHLKAKQVVNANGWVWTYYDEDGTLLATENYDTTGKLISVKSLSLGDAAYSYWTGASIGSALDVSGMKLTFSEDFNSFSASPGAGTVWKTMMPHGARSFDVNREIEYYTDSSVGGNPFTVANGVLTITAKTAAAGTVPAGKSWTSGTITTESSFAQEYGYFEMRAQLPTGAGIWPAFWLLPASGNWPPELDVVEAIGKGATTVYGSTHGGTQAAETTIANTITTANISTGFHTYGVDWKPTTITWYIDGVAVASEATPSDLNVPMYLLANLAVGGVGSWPGAPDGTVSSAQMQIDYIRAYATASTVSAGLTLAGNATTPNLVGYAGNDVFTLGAGTVSVDGGAGTNVASTMSWWGLAGWTHSNADGSWGLTTSVLGTISVKNLSSITFWGATVNISGSTLTAVDGNGATIWTDTFAADNTAVANYYTNNVLTERDIYNAAGVRIKQTGYAADGSTTVFLYDATGAKTSQQGYTSGGTPTYANSYDAASGRLIEQDGYDAGGHKTSVAIIAADGSSTRTGYDASGTVTEVDLINAAGYATKNTYYAADHSYSIALRTATGILTEVDSYTSGNVLATVNLYSVSTGNMTEQYGLTSGGAKTYDNFYDPASSGRLIEQDLYTNGVKTSVQVYAADGSSTLTSYTSSGVVKEIDLINASGIALSKSAYPGDGTHTTSLYNASAQLYEIDSYRSDGTKQWTNLYYPAATSVLKEQDAYDANGVLTASYWYNSAGTKLTTTALKSGSTSSHTVVSAGNGAFLYDPHTVGGGASNDTFSGTGTGRTFLFTGEVGADTISNFRTGAATGHDVISISKSLVADYATLIAATHDSGGSAVINLGTHGTITLTSVLTSTLVSADFAFV